MHRILFVIVPLLISGFCLADEALGYKGKNGKVFGYESVELALEALRNKPNVDISGKGGWTIVSDNAEKALWSFAPVNHSAYPSVVRRVVVEENGQIFIDTQVRCGAEKVDCDKLVQDFIELNSKVTQEVNGAKGT
ncbi:hypothetical protein [Alteromonas confluentis]|uniref:Molecular chaperone DnaJ n=1 Tax=Alteromonas confluentis TaxID=1656094 RepID=A0A1E7ZDX8_9ALTE|nr:hypothetical protein [Alteromonas confluentis]OFC71680.1 hypothetical protein BFC18_05850 [Alteromonas confluentis]